MSGTETALVYLLLFFRLWRRELWAGCGRVWDAAVWERRRVFPEIWLQTLQSSAWSGHGLQLRERSRIPVPLPRWIYRSGPDTSVWIQPLQRPKMMHNYQNELDSVWWLLLIVFTVCLITLTNFTIHICHMDRAGSRHGQGWAKPIQMTVLPTQSELDKDYVIFVCA